MMTGTEKVAKLAMLATEAVGGVLVLEAAHSSDPSLDAAMVLFKAIVHVGIGPVPTVFLNTLRIARGEEP